MKCVHGNDIGQSCKHCAEDSNQGQAAGQASMGSAVFTRHETVQNLNSSACSYCGNHVGHKPDCRYHLANHAQPMSGSWLEQAAMNSMNQGTFVEVPSHRDQLNERLCNELAYLSRNVAGLTGVSQALLDVGERMGHGAPKPCPEKHLKDYDSSELRSELWRRNGEVVPQPRGLVESALDQAVHSIMAITGCNASGQIKRCLRKLLMDFEGTYAAPAQKGSYFGS